MYGFAFLPLAIIAGFVYLIVYLSRSNKDRKSHDQAFFWKRFGVATAISFILPFFIGFSTSAIFDKLQSTNSFIMMVAASVIFLFIGLIVGHHTVISSSLIIGSLIMLVYAIGLNFQDVPPSVIAILAGIGLAILIFVAYKKLQDKEAK